MPFYWQTPSGSHPALYQRMIDQPHLMIAGATGSGKSVVINGLIYTMLYNSPSAAELILIDPKRVELSQYRNLPHTLLYASEPDDMHSALQFAMTLTDNRFRALQRGNGKTWGGSHVYVIIDELADLMTTDKKRVQPLIQRLAQVGRAARVHVIAATQCPIAAVIPTPIKVNFDTRVGLRTRSAQDSRNILGVSGCEKLPRYGQGYFLTPEGLELYTLPLIPDTDISRITRYWITDKNRRVWRWR